MYDLAKMRKPTFVLVAVSLVGLTLSGCDGGGPVIGESGLEVVLENDPSNGLPIHILGPGEDFSPSNRLEPGENRTIRVDTEVNENIGFTAGRNGDISDGSVCEVRESGTGFVVWFDGVLECQGSLALVSRF